MTEPIIIDFEGNSTDLLIDAKKVDEALGKNAVSLNEAGSAAKKSSVSWTDFRSAYGVAMDVMQAGQQVWAQTVDVTLAYAGTVRDLAAISGTGAEESSRLLQVLDDYQISAEDVTAATKKMTSQGLTPTIETLATLADQYNALNDPLEQNELIIKNLGKSGLQWVNVLKQGGDALRSQSQAVNENLVLTDKQIEQTERYRLKIDEAKDTIEGYKIAATLAFFDVTDKAALHAEAINRVAEAHDMNAYVMQKQQGTYAEEISAMEDAITAEQELTESLKDNSAAMIENNDALVEIDYGRLISGIQGAQQETDRFNETNEELNQQIAEQTEKIQVLTSQGYSAMGETVMAEQEKLDALTGKLNDNATAHDRWQKQTVFAFAQAAAAADGQITQKEGMILTDMGVQLGLFDQKTADAMKKVTEAFNSVDPSSAESAIASVNDALNALDGTTATTYINVVTITTGGGGSCFLAGTPVTMADGSEAAIEDLVVGDVVSVYDFEKGANVSSEVVKVLHHTDNEMPGYYLVINDRIAVTPDHNMYTSSGWVQAGKLELGHALFTVDGTYETIVSMETIQERTPVYNIEVAHKDHNYYADGVLAHNSKPRTPTLTGGAVNAGSSSSVSSGGLTVNIESMNVFANNPDELAMSLSEL